MKIEGDVFIYFGEKSPAPKILKNTILTDNRIKLVEVITIPHLRSQVLSYEIVTNGGVVIKTMKETSTGQALMIFKKMTMQEFHRQNYIKTNVKPEYRIESNI